MNGWVWYCLHGDPPCTPYGRCSDGCRWVRTADVLRAYLSAEAWPFGSASFMVKPSGDGGITITQCPREQTGGTG